MSTWDPHASSDEAQLGAGGGTPAEAFSAFLAGLSFRRRLGVEGSKQTAPTTRSENSTIPDLNLIFGWLGPLRDAFGAHTDIYIYTHTYIYI